MVVVGVDGTDLYGAGFLECVEAVESAHEQLEEEHSIDKTARGNTIMPSDRPVRVERLWAQCLLLVVQNTNLRHRRREAIKKLPSAGGSAGRATLQRQIPKTLSGLAEISAKPISGSSWTCGKGVGNTPTSTTGT